MRYPRVTSELDTLEQVVSGRSLARFGDSELAVAEGRSCSTQRADTGLAARLGQILRGDAGFCMVGIPNLRAPIERAVFWDGYAERFGKFLNPRKCYVSSFLSRPEITPWIDVPDYWVKMESLWKDQNVTLIRGGDPVPQEANPAKLSGAVSLVAADLTSARSVTEIVGPAINAWTAYDSLMAQVDPEKRTLLCLGSTATVLAVDICARGGHAIDLGHFGMYLKRHRAGEPMKRNKRRVA